MSNLLVSSLQEVQQIENLLAKELPNYRKAYSDRTAWLMAFLSEIAYIKFNPVFKNRSKQQLLELVEEVSEKKNLKSLSKLLQNFDYDPAVEKQKLIENADFLKLKLIHTYDQNGSQAILLENDTNLFLAFRGTEPTQIKDIKADLNALIQPCESGGRIHTGFDSAFAQIAIDIQTTLNQEQFKSKPLYITGHSLGGALATVAAKKLKHQAGIAACYTFGAPRVGDILWSTNIKTPIYRIVNAHDPVTLLPPSSIVIESMAWILGWLPWLGKAIKEKLVSRFGGYYHCGNMRYLSACKAGEHDKVQLLYSVSFFYRLMTFFKQKISACDMPADHSIGIYKNKLKIIAMRRNNL